MDSSVLFEQRLWLPQGMVHKGQHSIHSSELGEQQQQLFDLYLNLHEQHHRTQDPPQTL